MNEKRKKINTNERIARIPRMYIAYIKEIFNRPRTISRKFLIMSVTLIMRRHRTCHSISIKEKGIRNAISHDSTVSFHVKTFRNSFNHGPIQARCINYRAF